ncbi:hemin uptake protein HemP [Polaromonas sp. CG_9.5]|uniref:hemin uptake protein HemP n=1 Tax=Polaromonas sp. CG_9.5 TaxID=3071705 RepID=UPI002DF81D3F|nr:hemin uptake protein HemP [Polaromonas sp. CG_9.5]
MRKDSFPLEPQNVITANPASASEPNRPATGTRSGCVDSTDLLRGEKTVEISHNGSTYRLQATRLGKLILTK